MFHLSQLECICDLSNILIYCKVFDLLAVSRIQHATLEDVDVLILAYDLSAIYFCHQEFKNLIFVDKRDGPSERAGAIAHSMS